MFLVTFTLMLFAAFACSKGDSEVLPPYLTAEELSIARNSFLVPLVPDDTRYYNRTEHSHNDCVEPKSSRNFFRHAIWQGGRVPYTLNPNLSPDNRVQVAIAFEDYRSKTCIRFVPKEASDVAVVDILRDDTTCGLAHVCRLGGPQWAKFGSGCQDAATMIHELGHTLCMSHEQDRADRDQYIRFEGCDGGTPLPISDWTTPSLYDYYSVMHYGGCWPGACMQAKQNLPYNYCGNSGRLTVLDAEKINERYDCQGCLSYRFKAFNKLTPQDNLVSSGFDQFGRVLHICRFYVNGEIVVGKASIEMRACWVPYENSEIGSRDETFEVLTNPKNVQLTWRSTSKNQPIPAGSIAGGRRTHTGQYLVLPETYYIARCNWNGQVVPGKAHGESRRMFFPYGGRSYECDNYEVLTCN